MSLGLMIIFAFSIAKNNSGLFCLQHSAHKLILATFPWKADEEKRLKFLCVF